MAVDVPESGRSRIDRPLNLRAVQILLGQATRVRDFEEGIAMALFEVWTALAIVLTGTFGILGLATAFRRESSKKITRWGYVSLAVIIVSTTGGV